MLRIDLNNNFFRKLIYFKKYLFILSALPLLILFNLLLWANADVLHLKNGRSIEGLIKKETADNVELEISFGSMKFSKDQIENIERSSPVQVELIRQEWSEEKAKVQERAKAVEEEREHAPKQVSVDKKSGHVIVVTTLNKEVKANLVLDTGASLMMLSNKVAVSLGSSINSSSGKVIDLIMADGRRVEAKMVILDSVSVQDSEVQNVEAAVLSAEDSDAVVGDGLLGMSFLKHFNFKIDQKYGKLILEKL
ncbi:MAG: retropepsin-like aspartic protease [Candidatus Omnitrophota bacterium]